MKRIYKYLFLLFAGIFFNPFPLQSQVICQGPGCQLMPLSNQELNELLLQFQYQYVDELVTDMSEAGNSAILTGVPGTPLMNGNYYGALTIPVAYESRHDIWITSPRYQTATALESAGVAVLPRLQFGYRHPLSEESKGDAGFLERLLSRFEIYGSYFDYTYHKDLKPELDTSRLFNTDMNALISGSSGSSGSTESQLQPDFEKAIVPSDGYRIKWDHFGLATRYRIFENFDLAGPLVEFAGLSGSVGYYEDRFSVDFLMNGQSTKINVTGGDGLDWNYSMLANYRMSTKTIPVEVRSGITFLTFFSVNAGVGMGYTESHYEMSSLLGGPVTILPGGLLAQIASYVNPALGTTYLGFYLRSSKNIRTYNPYFRPGVEFHMGAVRVTLEGIMMRGASDTFILNFAVDI